MYFISLWNDPMLLYIFELNAALFILFYSPSTIFYHCLSCSQHHRGLEPIPATSRWWQGAASKSCQFVTGPTKRSTLTFTPMANLQLSIYLTGMPSEEARVPEFPHRCTEIMQTPRRKTLVGTEPKTFMLWGDSATYSTAMLPLFHFGFV